VTLGVVTGLRLEQRIITAALADLIAGGQVLVRHTAARRPGAEAAVSELVAHQIVGLVSIGFAGGLTDDATAGSLIIGSQVVCEDGSIFEADPAWSQQLAGQLKSVGTGGLPAQLSPIAGVDSPVLSVSAKQAVAARTGAAAVDMESHIVAAAARAASLPFAVLRVVSDPADTTVPAGAVAAIKPNGRIAGGVLLTYLLTHPGELGAFIRLGGYNRVAKPELSRAASALRALV